VTGGGTAGGGGGGGGVVAREPGRCAAEAGVDDDRSVSPAASSGTAAAPPTVNGTQSRRLEYCNEACYSAHDREARSIVMSLSVCLSVCLSAIVFRTTRPIFAKFFLFILLMVVARCSSGGVVIRYVLPVL